MLDGAAQHFARAGLERGQVLRVDVPGRGAGEEGDGALRTELEPVIPLLQSGSLFGEGQGLQLVDAQNLQASEGAVLEELFETADLSTIEVVILATGALPRSLSTLVKRLGSSQTVRKMWERQALQWLEAEVRDRGLTLEKGAGEGPSPEIWLRYGSHGTGARSARAGQRENHQGGRARPVQEPSRRADLPDHRCHVERRRWGGAATSLGFPRPRASVGVSGGCRVGSEEASACSGGAGRADVPPMDWRHGLPIGGRQGSGHSGDGSGSRRCDELKRPWCGRTG